MFDSCSQTEFGVNETTNTLTGEAPMFTQTESSKNRLQYDNYDKWNPSWIVVWVPLCFCRDKSCFHPFQPRETNHSCAAVCALEGWCLPCQRTIRVKELERLSSFRTVLFQQLMHLQTYKHTGFPTLQMNGWDKSPCILWHHLCCHYPLRASECRLG